MKNRKNITNTNTLSLPSARSNAARWPARWHAPRCRRCEAPAPDGSHWEAAGGARSCCHQQLIHVTSLLRPSSIPVPEKLFLPFTLTDASTAQKSNNKQSNHSHSVKASSDRVYNLGAHRSERITFHFLQHSRGRLGGWVVYLLFWRGSAQIIWKHPCIGNRVAAICKQKTTRTRAFGGSAHVHAPLCSPTLELFSLSYTRGTHTHTQTCVRNQQSYFLIADIAEFAGKTRRQAHTISAIDSGFPRCRVCQSGFDAALFPTLFVLRQGSVAGLWSSLLRLNWTIMKKENFVRKELWFLVVSF